jgi:threonine dehydratase
MLVVAIGGGGLISGIAIAASDQAFVEVVGVEMVRFPAMYHAMKGTQPVFAASTVAEGIAVKEPGKLTREIIAREVKDILLVDEGDIEESIVMLLEIEKTVVEGAGAAPLAALLNRSLGLAGRRVALVLSGGNIDVTMVARIITRGLVKDGRLVRLGVVLQDRPGARARLTALIGEERVNILQIEHDRAFSRQSIGSSEVALTLETSGRLQIDDLKTRLESAGYVVEERSG